MSLIALTAGHSIGIYLIQNKSAILDVSSTKALPLIEPPAGWPHHLQWKQKAAKQMQMSGLGLTLLRPKGSEEDERGEKNEWVVPSGNVLNAFSH